MKILVVRLSSIGDVVHTLPVLAALARHGFDVGWSVEPSSASLLEDHPLLRHVVRVPAARMFRLGAALEARRALGMQGYDVALDFQGLWKSVVWSRLSGAPRIVGYSPAWRREPLSAVLLGEPVDLPGDLPHVIDKNLAMLRAIGIEAVGLRDFPLPPTVEQAAEVHSRLAELGFGDFAILNPGGGWAGKLWGPEGYARLAQGLRERGLKPLVTWGPGEERLADRVAAASSGAALRCFPTTLLHFVELARRARVVVSADTGPLHLACAVGTPVVGLYGPTDPARNGPFSTHDMVVRRTPLCSPCHKRRCVIHEGVMDAIAPGEVLRAVERRLQMGPSKAIAV